MSEEGEFRPKWREDVPAAGTYRSIFKYDPNQFKHPSRAWYEMFKQEFGMTDDDFRTRRPGGDEQVVVAPKCGLERRPGERVPQHRRQGERLHATTTAGSSTATASRSTRTLPCERVSSARCPTWWSIRATRKTS